MKSHYIIAVIFIGLLCNSVNAQFDDAQIGIHFQTAIPLGELAQASDKVAFGGDVETYLSISEFIDVGLNLSLMNFESYSKDLTFTVPGGVQFYRQNISSNMFSGYAGIRVKPWDGIVRPYVEGLIGFQNYYSKHCLEQQVGTDFRWEEVDRSTRNSWTLSYGVSTGLMIFTGGHDNFYIDVKCTYIKGGKINIYRLNDEIDLDEFIRDPYSAFNIIESKSHLLIPAIGIGVIF